MPGVKDKIEPLTFVFEDDGLVPNNPLPLLLYKRAIEVDSADPEREIEQLFGANGWGDMWRDGIYDYPHYHSTAHEALGVAKGHARVRFGGDRGREFEISAGDVAILPAGTGHQMPLRQPRFVRGRRLSARTEYGDHPADAGQSCPRAQGDSKGEAAEGRSCDGGRRTAGAAVETSVASSINHRGVK